MNKLITILIFIVLVTAIDLYLFQGIKTLANRWAPEKIGTFKWIHFGLLAISVLGIVALNVKGRGVDGTGWVILRTFVVMIYLTKLLWVSMLLIDDVWRAVQWVYYAGTSKTPASGSISRSTFLNSAGLFMTGGMITALTYGVAKGAHDYRVVRQKLVLPNLPKSFEGLKLVQISDLHSGSFWNTEAMAKGIDVLNSLNADLVFFTGDLVNNKAEEVKELIPIYKNIKAPLGVYSVLGNHDYGDYVEWPSAEHKAKNLNQLIKYQREEMGWDLLINESRVIKKGSDELAIVGIENWGAKGRFPKYGKMKEAIKGTESAAVKLLLSHDPSHWRAEVLKDYPDVDVMFAGHTHGMQFGIETAGFKWSPVKYFYQEWAGLYQEAHQMLYVNRGFGYLGYPGRLGINPEITLFELTCEA